MQLLGKEINAKIAVLTSLGGGRDSNDLAGATLQDQKIPNADVVTGNGDGAAAVVAAVTFEVPDIFTLTVTNASGSAFMMILALNDDLLAVMLVARMEWVEDTVSGIFKAMTKGVVVAFVVVVTHSVIVLFVGPSAFVFDVVRGLLSVMSVVTLGHVNVLVVPVDFYFDFATCVVTT